MALDIRALTYIDNYESTLSADFNANTSQLYLPQADIDILDAIITQYGGYDGAYNYLGALMTLDDENGKIEIVQIYNVTAGSGYASALRDVFNINGVEGVGLNWVSGSKVSCRLNAGQQRLCDNQRLSLYRHLTHSGAITCYADFANNRVSYLTLTGDAQITVRYNPSDPADALWKHTIIIKQDATGGRSVTSWQNVVWPNGTAPVLSSSGNAIDVFELVRLNGSNVWLGMVVAQNLPG